MNCKPGDLAVVVRARNRPHLLGRIVFCVRLHDSEKIDADGIMFFAASMNPGPRWVIDPPLEDLKTIADAVLRPIRDQPGEDETIRIAGLPCTTKQPELTT